MVIELQDEIDLIELYRLLSPEQKARILAMLKDMTPRKEAE